MSRFRDFDVARAENVGEPLTFRLAERDFIIDRVPAGPLLDLAGQAGLKDADALVAFGRFLAHLVREDQRDAMREALDDTDLLTLLALVQWVIEESTARPLASVSSLSDGASANGAKSKLDAASAGWTPSP